MEHIFDVIIIGGGPAGYSAALYTSRAGLDTLVIEKAAPGGQMTLTDIIDNYPGFNEGIDGFTLAMNMYSGAERFGARTEYAQVTLADLTENIKKIATSSGTFYARSVIIATGAEPRRLGLDGEDALVGRGLHYCAHCDGRFYKDKSVIVVGGGNSAVSDALYLSHLCKKVIIVHRRDSLRATKIYHEPLMKAHNVEFLWNSVIDGYITDNRVIGTKVRNINDGTVTDIMCDGIFVSIGREPISEMFKGQIDIDNYGYIIADESTRTNVNGVFAVGDVRTKALRQVITAASDGAVAAHYAEEYISSLK